MRIVFGWYSWTVKEYTPEELEIPNESEQKIKFEVRQKAFHLFYIPFFSIGKMYAIRKEGQLYDMPYRFEKLIKSKGKVKTPWYTFALPILAVFIASIYFLTIQFESYKRNKYHNEEYNYAIAQIDKELEHLTTNHYIKIVNLANKYESEGMYLKVENIKGSIVTVMPLITGLKDYNSYAYAVKDYYIINKDSAKLINLTIEDLQKSVCRDYDLFNQRSPFGQPLLNDGKNYAIERIEYIKGPVIKDRGTGSHGGPRLSFEFQNFGSPVNLVEFTNIENNIKWTTTLPQYIPTDSNDHRRFRVEGTNYLPGTEYKFMMTFSDSLGEMYQYTVTGRDFDKRIERVVE